MTAVAAAVTKARSLLAFVGILTLLGLDLTTVTRIIIGLALAAAVGMESSADGHRIWPRIPKPTGYKTAA